MSVEIINEAKKHILGFKSFSKYVDWFINVIETCGLTIDRSALRIDYSGIPIITSNRKGQSQAGRYHAIQAPAEPTNGNNGIIINNCLNIRLQEVIIVTEGKLYLSSYSYHVEMLNEQRYPYFRYEKRALPHAIEDYAPLFHLHVAGRLPHMPASRVSIKNVLGNIKENLLNPELARRLSDGLWYELGDTERAT